jgi:hypothetical protein
VFQFPFFDKWKIKDRHESTDRLIPVPEEAASGPPVCDRDSKQEMARC